MKNTLLPWKKSVSDIADMLEKSQRLDGQYRIVACVKKVRASAIEKGVYSHLDIFFTPDGISYPRTLLPSPDIGGYSRINVHGKEVVHKELPMITKTFCMEAPNFGDYSKGSHEICHDREVYQRSFIAPKNLEIKIELLGQEMRGGEDVYVFKFSINELLDAESDTFEDELHYNANLLQANVGSVDVFASTATREDYLRTVYIGWEILPPGTRDETISRIIGTRTGVTAEQRGRIEQRYRVFERLKPQSIIRGTSGFQRYFGAKFADDLVVFENLDYGNALYVMNEDWETLSRMSRLDLLKGDGKGFTRIVHTSGWEAKLERLVEKHRELQLV
jgi:hypothetical protein